MPKALGVVSLFCFAEFYEAPSDYLNSQLPFQNCIQNASNLQVINQLYKLFWLF